MLSCVLFLSCEKVPKEADPNWDIVSDYKNNYTFDQALLPKVGEKEEEVYKRLGIPTRRWTFQEVQELQFPKEKVSFNRILLYGSGKVINYKADGYSGFETVESIDVSVFLFRGTVQKTSVKHLVREPTDQNFSIGPFDSKDTKVMKPIIESFPNSSLTQEKYWDQFGGPPLSKLEIEDPKWLKVVENAMKYRDIPSRDYEDILFRRKGIIRYPLRESWYKYGILEEKTKQ